MSKYNQICPLLHLSTLSLCGNQKRDKESEDIPVAGGITTAWKTGGAGGAGGDFERFASSQIDPIATGPSLGGRGAGTQNREKKRFAEIFRI